MNKMIKISEEEPSSILLVASKTPDFVKELKSVLQKYGRVFFSSTPPKIFTQFEYIFLIDPDVSLLAAITPQKKIVCLFLNNQIKAERFQSRIHKNVKVISIEGESDFKKIIDRILWFSLSRSNEYFLRIKMTRQKTPAQIFKVNLNFIWKLKSFSKPKIALFILAGIFLFHLLFFIPLFFSSYYLYQSSQKILKDEKTGLGATLKKGQFSLSSASFLYSISRPALLLFSLALFPDNVFDLNKKAYQSLELFRLIEEDAKNVLTLFLTKNKTVEEKNILVFRLERIKNNIPVIQDDLEFLEQKLFYEFGFLKKIKSDLQSANKIISDMQKFIPFIDNLFAKEVQKKYLLLFANNKELRPGGGFIGSFGILTVKDFTLEEISIYDVYDADGQLETHVEPPTPIRIHLQQPHWFLRDSAFSPDFLDNYSQAKNFLDIEMKFKDFSGAVLITTSAIENLLTAFEDVYISDYNEIINHKNFYLKAQLYSEKNFFPGSIQKKNFLASLMDTILLNLENASTSKITHAVKESLEEKQIVLYFDNSKLQKVIDSLYWSGRIIQPVCPTPAKKCIIDYLFPYDANLGVNKANFFIERSMEITTTILSDGSILHDYTLIIKNNSPSEVFPGGNYKNYFQILLPLDSTIKNITKDFTAIEFYDERDDLFKKIGFLVIVKPKSSSKIRISYKLKEKIMDRNTTYQFILQKQIGSSNNDLLFKLNLPKNFSAGSSNFTSLVKNNQIFYNTTLSADKIFYIELNKE